MLSAILLASALVAAAPSSPRVPAPGADTAHVVLVATTDVHGHATAWDYTTGAPFPGGLVRAATIVDSLRAAYPGQVVVVDAGDLIQGNPFATYFAQVAPRDPNPIVEAMNLIGYDAATPGNHEFNWGLDVWRRAVAGAQFNYVSANVFAEPGDTLMFRPFTVVRRGPVRVGIAGFTTPGVMVWDRENVKGRARVGRVETGAARVVRALAGQADLRIVLIHSGMNAPASYDTTGVGAENVATSLATLPVKPDFVVVGHSHREMRDSVVNGVHFVQPKNYVQSVTVTHIDLVRQGRAWRPVRTRTDLVPLKTVPPDPRLVRALAGADSAVRAWTAQPLAEATGPMPAAFARVGSTPLLTWIHAVQRARTGAQLSAASAFNLRAGFRPGPIRMADVAALYPYENTLRAIRVSGAQLKAYLEQSARYYTTDAAGRVVVNDSIPGYNFDEIGGASYAMDLTRPIGSRIVDLAVAGRPVQPADSFTLALNSYRQGGGGGYDMIKGAPVVYDRAENIRELLVDDLRARKTLDPARFAPAPASSWRVAPAPTEAQVRALFAEGPRETQGVGVTPGVPARRDSVALRVLATSDLHGNLLPRTYDWSRGQRVGGVAALKGLMDSLVAECGCATLRLDAGDQMQGTLISSTSRGRTTVAAFNALGLDAAALGNHDFDWSVDTLRARMREASYPWLGANVVDSATGRRPVWVTPWKLVTVGGLKVALVGYVTPETNRIVKRAALGAVRVDSGVAAIRGVLDTVRAAHPDLTIVIAHEGARCDTAGACKGAILGLARELAQEPGPRPVDLIVAGHAHWLLDMQVAGIPIVEPRNNGMALGVIDFVRGRAGLEARPRVLTVWTDSVRADTALAAQVERWQAPIDAMTRRVVARVALPLNRDEPQYPLGNLIADARRNVLRADAALVNNGGIRADLPAGPVTYGQLFQVQPFGNELVTVTLTGAELKRMLERVLAAGEPDEHVAGIVVRWDSTAPAGQRVRGVRFTDGRVLKDKARYTLATDDYLAGGGSGFTMLAGRPTKRSGIVDVDGLITYLRRLPQPVRAPEEPRFVAVTR
ncbi:MAG TPA: 5'-nucleotidase C-terminal domain-containing protein [Gemmatimonadales bacterium]|nr:5'-nucleotidase C-terminal domain-containing protein [Gemmatimonadales bacterium]